MAKNMKKMGDNEAMSGLSKHRNRRRQNTQGNILSKMQPGTSFTS